MSMIRSFFSSILGERGTLNGRDDARTQSSHGTSRSSTCRGGGDHDSYGGIGINDMEGETPRQKYKPAAFDVWCLGIVIVIGGQYFSFNEGLKAGFGSYLISTLLMGSAYACLIFCMAEMTSGLPFSGGAYGMARVVFGYYPGFLIGITEALEYIFYVSSSVLVLGDMIGDLLQTDQSYKPLYWLIFYISSLYIHTYGGTVFWSTNTFLALVSFTILLIYCFGSLKWVNISVYGNFSYNEGTTDDDSPHRNFDSVTTSDVNNNMFIGGMKLWLKTFPLSGWFFVGCESLTFSCDMVENPAKAIPKGAISCVLTLFASAIFTLCVCSSLPPGIAYTSRQLLPLNAGFTKIFNCSKYYATILSLPATYATSFGFMFSYGKLNFALASSALLPRSWTVTLGNDGKKDPPFISMLMGSAISYLICYLVFYWPYLGSQLFNICILSAFVAYCAQCGGFIAFRTRFRGIRRKFHSPFGIVGATYSFFVFMIGIVAVVGFQDDNQFAVLVLLGIYCLSSLYYFLYASSQQIFSDEERIVLVRAHVINSANEARRRLLGHETNFIDTLWLYFTSDVNYQQYPPSHIDGSMGSVSASAAAAAASATLPQGSIDSLDIVHRPQIMRQTEELFGVDGGANDVGVGVGGVGGNNIDVLDIHVDLGESEDNRFHAFLETMRKNAANTDNVNVTFAVPQQQGSLNNSVSELHSYLSSSFHAGEKNTTTATAAAAGRGDGGGVGGGGGGGGGSYVGGMIVMSALRNDLARLPRRIVKYGENPFTDIISSHVGEGHVANASAGRGSYDHVGLGMYPAGRGPQSKIKPNSNPNAKMSRLTQKFWGSSTLDPKHINNNNNNATSPWKKMSAMKMTEMVSKTTSSSSSSSSSKISIKPLYRLYFESKYNHQLVQRHFQAVSIYTKRDIISVMQEWTYAYYHCKFRLNECKASYVQAKMAHLSREAIDVEQVLTSFQNKCSSLESRLFNELKALCLQFESLQALHSVGGGADTANKAGHLSVVFSGLDALKDQIDKHTRDAFLEIEKINHAGLQLYKNLTQQTSKNKPPKVISLSASTSSSSSSSSSSSTSTGSSTGSSTPPSNVFTCDSRLKESFDQWQRLSMEIILEWKKQQLEAEAIFDGERVKNMRRSLSRELRSGNLTSATSPFHGNGNGSSSGTKHALMGGGMMDHASILSLATGSQDDDICESSGDASKSKPTNSSKDGEFCDNAVSASTAAVSVNANANTKNNSNSNNINNSQASIDHHNDSQIALVMSLLISEIEEELEGCAIFDPTSELQEDLVQDTEASFSLERQSVDMLLDFAGRHGGIVQYYTIKSPALLQLRHKMDHGYKALKSQLDDLESSVLRSSASIVDLPLYRRERSGSETTRHSSSSSSHPHSIASTAAMTMTTSNASNVDPMETSGLLQPHSMV